MHSILVKTPLYGKPLKKRKVSAFTLTERFYPPHFKTPKHSHDNALFCLVLRGNYTETYGQKTRECLPATALFHASDDPHAEHFHENGGHSFIVEIDQQWIRKLRDEIGFPNISADFKNGNLPQLGAKLYQEFQRFDTLSPLIIEGLILEITGETARQSLSSKKYRKPIWLAKAESYLEECYREHISLKEVADHVEIHPVHLAQTFRKFHQTTVGNYLRQIRLENARRALAESKKTITEISFANGFSDQSHFSRLFKKEYGIPPSEYRRFL